MRSRQTEHHRAIEASALAALRSEPLLGPTFHADELRLEADGVLLLRGEVSDVASKKVALARVAAIPGVSAIADHLHVRPAAVMGDKEIRVHVRNALIDELSFAALEIQEVVTDEPELARGAPLGSRGRISVEVKQGLVILNGEVPGLTSKRLAGVIAWWVPGVRDVINGLAVQPPEEDSPDHIAEAVRVVHEKDPFVYASLITVDVQRRTVRLGGIVPSEVARRAAVRDAWMLFGVDRVIDEISVRP